MSTTVPTVKTPPQTVGSASNELLQKTFEKINVIDLQREIQKSFPKMMEKIISTHKGYADKYYIVIMFIKERLLKNVIRQKFIVRKSRPLPVYDCSLYSYDNKKDQLEYHWTIPDEGACEYMLHNADNLPKDEKQLLGFVQRYCARTLV